MLDQHRLHSSTKSFHSLASKGGSLHQVVVDMSSQLVRRIHAHCMACTLAHLVM